MTFLLRMAWPRTQADRTRMLLVACSVAIAGAFVLAGARVARLGLTSYLPYESYSNYLAESGLRKGVVFAALLMVAPGLALAVQALRLGTAARERRLAAFRLAGATPAQVRWVSAVEAGAAGLAGGVLAGPAYLLMAALFAGLPRMARLLPSPTAGDLPVWLATVAAATVAGGLAGWSVHRQVVDDPLAVKRGGRTGPPGRGSLAIAGLGLALVALGRIGRDGYEAPFLAVGGLIVAGLAGGPWLVLWRGRRLSRSNQAYDVLAGARLVSDSRPAGRMAALLLLCGCVIGFSATSTRAVFADRIDAAAFFLTGFGMTISAALFAVLTVALALTIGAADELVRHRRQIASLVALGTEPQHLRLAIHRQLTAVAPWVTTGGALIGGGLVPIATNWSFGRGQLALIGIMAAVVTGCLTWLGCALAAQLLRGQLSDAMDPENLRAD